MDGVGLTAAIGAGASHNCIAKTNKTAWCWGDNTSGQAGDMTTNSPKSLPVQVTTLGMTAVQVAGGNGHSCARKDDGTLWCWGKNDKGQLGDGTTMTPKTTPVQVTALGFTVAYVATGSNHTCARDTNNKLYCWGDNTYGQLGDGLTAARSSPFELTGLGANVAGIVASLNHTCALTVDKKLWCWGRNHKGQLGQGSTSALQPSPMEVTALGATVTDVSISLAHTCALKDDGTVWCWGENLYAQIGDGTAIDKSLPAKTNIPQDTKIIDVSAGRYHTCARGADGSLWCWGWNSSGQIGDGTNAGAGCGTTTPCAINPVRIRLSCG
jgi:alpha-tubulin suppressor-like RCC1 family protein